MRGGQLPAMPVDRRWFGKTLIKCPLEFLRVGKEYSPLVYFSGMEPKECGSTALKV
jgi:hypothetical protein